MTHQFNWSVYVVHCCQQMTIPVTYMIQPHWNVLSNNLGGVWVVVLSLRSNEGGCRVGVEITVAYHFCHFLRQYFLLHKRSWTVTFDATAIHIIILLRDWCSVSVALSEVRCCHHRHHLFLIKVPAHHSAPLSAALAEGSRADCIQTISPRVQVSTRVRTCIPYWRALSGGRCRGSSATPFQFIFIIDCQPHHSPYRRWPSFPGRRCTCLLQSARFCHFCTFRSSLPVPP